MTSTSTKQDWADQHVARWRDHWVDVPFDDDTEAILIRAERIVRVLHSSTQDAVRQAGLQDYEFETLHHLMIRDTPGHASPSALADDLGISGAGMTGRLDALEKAGWVKRHQQTDDRRRIDVEVTKTGIEVWRKAMSLRNQVADNTVAALSKDERSALAGLLRKITVAIDH